ncbi:MAG: type III pantothenate kinase [Spirochaetales bacterium]|nr:type III pantothenate kinase [Spirochaetales bacterium]
MNLVIDAGNSQIYCGVFSQGEIKLRFRKAQSKSASSDELGVFFLSALRENGIDPKSITAVGCCSVVPEINHSLNNSIQKYFHVRPFFLEAGVKTGLQIQCKNPLEVGADRVADSIAACSRYPGKNIIVVDFGTATTIDAVKDGKKYCGGAILPGLNIAMRALEERTSMLPTVQIVNEVEVCGKTTTTSIQSGLYYGNLGAIREIVSRLHQKVFSNQDVTVIGTGGLARVFEDSGLFDALHPELVLEGVDIAMEMNK